MILEERIPSAFVTNSGRWPVAGIDNGFIRQNHKFFADTFHETFVAHSWKIGPADTKIEQRVAAEDHSTPREADSARAMSRCMKDFKVQVAQIYVVTIFE